MSVSERLCRVAAAALIAPSASFSYAFNLWNAKEAITAICSRVVWEVAMCQSGDFSATSSALRRPDQSVVDLGLSAACSQRLWVSEIILQADLTMLYTSPKYSSRISLCLLLLSMTLHTNRHTEVAHHKLIGSVEFKVVVFVPSDKAL